MEEGGTGAFHHESRAEVVLVVFLDHDGRGKATQNNQAKTHYRKQSLHRELEASARAKSAALGEAPLRREHKVWLSAKDWPTVISTFAESFLSSALGEGFG
jgi:hypothetical protein